MLCFSVAERKAGIEDRTETNFVNLRRVIYLTIMNALNYEEGVHKLLKIEIQESGNLSPFRFVACAKTNLIISRLSLSTCSLNVVPKNVPTLQKFYGLIGERFCKLNRIRTEHVEVAFNTYYTTIHRYQTFAPLFLGLCLNVSR
jgi:pre-mRNA-splicing factor CWC22